MISYLNQIFTLFLIAILFGIAIFLFSGELLLALCVLCLIGILVVLFMFYVPEKRFIFSGFFIVIGCLLGIGVAHINLLKIQENEAIVAKSLGLWTDQEGIVQELYRRSDFYDEYSIKITKLSGEVISSKLGSLLRIPKNFDLYPGQEISFSGKLYELGDFNGFAYKSYMLSKGLYYSSSASSFETLGEKRSGVIYQMYIYRQKLLARIEHIFPKKEAIFLGGILLGARENIPKDLKEDFNNSGLTHFIAVSGFNITLCVIFVTFLFGFLPSWGRIIMVLLTVGAFSFFVGLGAPVVRAAIMGVLAYIFLESGSGARNITLMAFTAVCMTLFSPLILLYDVSFHLSFLAVIGIVYTQAIFQRVFSFVPNMFAVREALVLTLASLTFTLPIMLFQFGQLSLLSPFANIAVTWTIPLAMLLGAVTLLFDLVSPGLSEFVGFFAWIFLKYDMLMVEFFGNIDFAILRFDIGAFKNYFQLLYFILLGYLLGLYHLKQKKSS